MTTEPAYNLSLDHYHDKVQNCSRFSNKKNDKVMIQITLPVIIISLQITIVNQECTNTPDIGMHKPIAWAQVTF